MSLIAAETSRLAADLRLLSESSKPGQKAHRYVSNLACILTRPLVLGLLGEHGAGQFSLVNTLLQREIYPAEFQSGQNHLAIIRYGETSETASIAPDGTRHRLTSKGVASIFRGRRAASSGAVKVIYKAKQRIAAFRSGVPAQTGDAATGQTPAQIAAIESRLPLHVLAHLEIYVFPPGQMPRRPSVLSKSSLGCPDILAWMTPAGGAWKQSEHRTWTSLPFRSRARSLLIVTDNETLTETSKAELESRLRDSAGQEFRDRVYLSLKDAATCVSAGVPIGNEEWEISGLPTLTVRLSALCERIRLARLARIRAIVDALQKRAMPEIPPGWMPKPARM